MNLAIVGAGAVGCLYGAKLARAGAKVTLVETRRERVAAIDQNGLHINGVSGEWRVHVQAEQRVSQPGQADVVLICVNGYSTADAAQTARRALTPDGFAITLQNGLGNIETLQAILGEERVVGGITFHSASSPQDGYVSHTGDGKTPIGELDGQSSARVQMLAGMLEKANLNPVVDAAIVETIWGKFVHNCALNAICGLTDLRPGHIRQVPELDEFQALVVEEALALVRAKGIQLSNPDPLGSIKEFCASRFHVVSMVQHLQKGLETEIDSLNGYLVKESHKLGLAAPYNDALTRLIKGRQHRPRE